MTQFLAAILKTKQQEVAQLLQRPVAKPDEERPTRGFARHLLHSPYLAVIAELKQASPSKGLIASKFQPSQRATLYAEGGAAAISVLTDEAYFRGSLRHLRSVRAVVDIPVLRKDFIIHEAQLDEARCAGADAVLLIVAALTPERLKQLANYAKSINLEPLVEVHHATEVKAALAANPAVIGINNRDLHTFQVNLETTERLMPLIPDEFPVIAESGICSPTDAERMAACGVTGILVGEALMRTADEAQTLDLLAQLQVRRQRAPVSGERA